MFRLVCVTFLSDQYISLMYILKIIICFLRDRFNALTTSLVRNFYAFFSWKKLRFSPTSLLFFVTPVQSTVTRKWSIDNCLPSSLQSSFDSLFTFKIYILSLSKISNLFFSFKINVEQLLRYWKYVLGNTILYNYDKRTSTFLGCF